MDWCFGYHIPFYVRKFALGIYFAKAELGSAYAVFGSVVLIMLCVSYSCMILFFDAEFTKQYALFHGHKIEPTKESEIINTEAEREQKK